MHIPPRTTILDAAAEYRASADRLKDHRTAAQIDRLIDAINQGAGFAWRLDTLDILSPSGGCYQVSAAGCSCPNGKAGHRQCWHWALRNLLIEMAEDFAAAADILADAAAERAEWAIDTDYYQAKAQTELPGYRPRANTAELGACLARARAALLSGNTGWSEA